MSAGVRVAIRLIVTPILVAALFGLLWYEHQQLRQDPRRMLILPLIVTAVSVGALLEIYRMARIKGHRPAWIAGTAYLLVKMAAVTIGLRSEETWANSVYIAVDTVFALYLLSKLVFWRRAFMPEDAALSFLAPAYVFMIKLAIDLYNRIPIRAPSVQGPGTDIDQLAQELQRVIVENRADHFILLLLFVFVASKVPDMLGYAVGKTMGKHPMAPILSPSKTWEGGIAGFCGGMIGSAAILLMTPLRQVLGLHPLLLIVLAGLVTISAMVGDLVKSAFKRWAGVKDSGLIPEFGGVLDIIDSFLLSVPTTYLFLSLVPRQF